MSKTETARHVMGGETRGKTVFLQMPDWILEREVYAPWKIYASDTLDLTQNESLESLFPFAAKE